MILHTCLRKLNLDWYEKKSFAGAPSLDRVWALAMHERGKRYKHRISDFELVGLVYDALNYCLPRFNRNQEPKKGRPDRRNVEDRFVWFFIGKLDWLIKDYLRATCENYRQPKWKSRRILRRENKVVFHFVDKATDQLSPAEREIIDLRYWRNYSWDELAKCLLLKDRFRARNELNRVQRKMKRIFEGKGGNPHFFAHRLPYILYGRRLPNNGRHEDGS
jgi:hypothetical protein